VSVRDKFKRVAGQRLVKISAEVLALESSDEPEAILAGLLRDMHTLKGEAGVLGLRGIASLAHALEDLLAQFQRHQETISAEGVDLCLHALDCLSRLVEGGELNEGSLDQLLAELRRQSQPGSPLGSSPAGPATTEQSAAAGEPLPTERPSEAHERGVARSDMATPVREGSARTLQVEPARLGKLSEVAGDLLVLVERNAARSQELFDLARGIRREHGAHTLPEWVERFEQLAYGYREDTFQNSQRVQELSEQLRVLRLSPLTSLLEGYRRAVRDLARSLDKEAQLVVEAEAVEVDQSVLEVVSEPLLHLVRNAIAHGLELPSQRELAGKPRAGTIRIGVSQTGSHVEIVVEDDGQGISPQLVAMEAELRGLLTAQEALELSEADAHELLFRPGFSTSALDQVSGRGVGLDVVRRSVEEHQGSLSLESELGKGTRFTLRLPMNLAMGEALICAAGGSCYAFATEGVVRVERLEPDSIQALGKGMGYRREGSVIPFCVLSRALGGEGDARPGDPVVVVRSRHGVQAIGVDSVLGQRRVVFRPLDPFIQDLPAVQSSCVLADGAIALLLNPGLVFQLGTGGIAIPGGRGSIRGSGQRVLVVEDSPVTRELVMEIVSNAGYQVVGAEDGLQALESLSSHQPDLVLTDLEMPRMDGIELTRRLRALDVTTPVVVITTRASDDERRACITAGADAFIDKSRFKEVVLLETIKRLIG
jgi:two-component system, chemotaxis family, sensor kinase CheA